MPKTDNSATTEAEKTKEGEKGEGEKDQGAEQKDPPSKHEKWAEQANEKILRKISIFSYKCIL